MQERPINLTKLAKRIQKICQGETAWRRACKDTDKFRQGNKWFWGMEVVGVAVLGVAGGLIGWMLVPTNANLFWQSAFPTIGGGLGVVVGFVIVYCGLFALNLCRAPYKQRNEARQQVRELKRLQRDNGQRSSRKDISLVYDPFFSICVERFQDGVELHRVGIYNNSNQTVSAGVAISSSYSLNPEPSILPLRPTYGAADSSGKLEVDPSAEFHLNHSVDFVRWNPKDRTIQICYFNNPYPEKDCVYKLVRGHRYSVSLCISVKNARVETEWQVKMCADNRRLNIDLSEIEVWEDL